MMKTLFLLVVVAVTGAALAETPVAKRTPNGGVEYYSNNHWNQGTVEHGCIIPWRYAGHVTNGYNPKLIELGEVVTEVDCTIEPPAAPTPVPAQVDYVDHAAPAPVPVPPPAPEPAPEPTPEPPHINE